MIDKKATKGINSQSRTDNVLRNTNVALICKGINVVLSFVARTIFIKMLGETYLGVNGIFSNILTIISFAELGIGTAIVYNLYKPLREHNEAEIGSLIAFYRKAYTIIGMLVVCIGLLVVPFLPLIIKEQPSIRESLTVLYVLSVLDSGLSYYNAHKRSLIIADQREYIVSIIHQIVHTAQIIGQIAVLYLTRNYLLYLIIQISFNACEGFVIGIVANRYYPFLGKYKRKPIEKELFQTIKKNVSALFIYKINGAILTGTDNILIATMEENGVHEVGYYSNYLLITNTMNMIVGIVTDALTPSVGNLNSEDNVQKQKSIFYTILFVSGWIYGYACSGLLALSNSFISCWIGNNYLLDYSVVLAIQLQLYIRGVHYAAYTYRTTNGLFVNAKYVPLLTSLINIVLSIVLGKIWGLFGILFATSIARVLTIGISDPVLVYKHVFHERVYFYYFKYIVLFLINTIGYLCAYYVLNLISLSGWGGFVVKSIVFSFVFNVIFFALTWKMNESKYMRKKIVYSVNRIIHKMI